MAASLYQSISPALTTLFGSIDGHAKAGAPVFPGSAGAIAKRRNQHGVEYYVRRFYGGDGRQQETYIGAGEEGRRKAEFLQAQILEVKALLPELRLLAREGFQSADPKTYATLASLHEHGLFAAGATLIGSHAFGVLVNQMGVRAAAYATEDVDVARREILAFDHFPEKSFLDMLRDSGIHFIEVPELDCRKPSSSFKQMGVSRFHVDLLVPSTDNEIHVVEVQELKAHATALPFLAYVLGQTQMATLISREGCCPVRIPVPERFAVHKLAVSQLRTNRNAKSEKDVFQAAVILAALGERFPGAIESAVMDLPVSARKYLTGASGFALGVMQAHPRACEELREAIARIAELE
ncbi:MAG: hypothetical protein H3C26_09080 [Rhodocyclaceae bacterium]|nr:hypothetical protein [Rhodocyclaceae bacterium]